MRAMQILKSPDEIPLAEKIPIYTESGVEIKNYKGIKIGNNVVAINSVRYNLLQHRVVAQTLRTVLEELKEYVIGREYTWGGRYVAELITTQPIERIGEDFKLMVLIKNSYDGTLALSIRGAAMRMMCMNILTGILPKEMQWVVPELNAAIGEGLYNKHTNITIANNLDKKINYGIKVVERTVLLGFSIYEKLKLIKVDTEMRHEFIDNLKEKLPSKYSNQIKIGSDTLWDLYNSATQVLTHRVQNPERMLQLSDTVKKEILRLAQKYVTK